MQSSKYPYLQNLGERRLIEPMPYLPLILEQEGNVKKVFGLLDSGSTVNVLPYKVGLELGGIWENQRISLLHHIIFNLSFVYLLSADNQFGNCLQLHI